MFLVPSVLFTTFLITGYCASQNQTNLSSYSYNDDESYTNTISRFEFGLNDIPYSNGAIHYRVNLEFKYENGKYTDVPDNVNVDYTGYVWLDISVGENNGVQFLDVSYGHSTSPINLLFSVQTIGFSYYKSNDPTSYDWWNYEPSQKPYNSVQDMLLTSRDDDDFQIWIEYGSADFPSYFIDDNDLIHLKSITFSFLVVALPEYEDVVAGDDYNMGYNDGYANGWTNGFTDGSETSYQNGYEEGYETGYGNGYNYGFDLGNNASLDVRRVFFQIADVPIVTLRGLFDFELFGINMYAILGSFIALFVFVLVIRKLI